MGLEIAGHLRIHQRTQIHNLGAVIAPGERPHKGRVALHLAWQLSLEREKLRVPPVAGSAMVLGSLLKRAGLPKAMRRSGQTDKRVATLENPREGGLHGRAEAPGSYPHRHLAAVSKIAPEPLLVQRQHFVEKPEVFRPALPHSVRQQGHMLALRVEVLHESLRGIEPHDKVADIVQAHDQDPISLWNAGRPEGKLIRREQQLQPSPCLDRPERARKQPLHTPFPSNLHLM